MGLRARWWRAFFGKPSGPVGRVGAWLMTKQVSFHTAMAAELDLQPDDSLLDVGCGSAGMLVEQAAHVGHVAGLDASEIQVAMARRRLADRIAAGSAEIVLGDAGTLPWPDGRFSVVSSLNCMKFVPDPAAALREIRRVLRPGGRAVITMCDTNQGPIGSSDTSGSRNAWGEWYWAAADVRRLMDDAGFTDITLSVLPILNKPWLARGAKPATARPAGTPVDTELLAAAATH
jgi:ubiquinone/menaquinone biosynthesis C-methylase UbiE